MNPESSQSTQPTVIYTSTVYSETTTPLSDNMSSNLSSNLSSNMTPDVSSNMSSNIPHSSVPMTSPSPVINQTPLPSQQVPMGMGMGTIGTPTGSATEYQAHQEGKTGRTKDSIFFTGPLPSSGANQYLRTIERDQHEFRRLYNDYLSAISLSEKSEIKNELIRGLSIHDFITETVLYPAILREVPNGSELVGHFKTRDASLRQSLVTLDRMKIEDPTFQQTFATMYEELERNMSDKQLNLLPELQRVIRIEKAEELGRDLDSARKKAPTRPHTSAATSSVLGALAAPIDKLKDKMRDFAGGSTHSQSSAIGGTVPHSGMGVYSTTAHPQSQMMYTDPSGK